MLEEDKVLNHILKKIEKAIHLKNFPNITKKGKWETAKDGYWTGGFWVGLLWWVFKITGDNNYKKQAYK